MPHSSDAESKLACRLSEILRIHFDPQGGSPYWIETATRLPFDPRYDIRSVQDLHRFGFMDQNALRTRPLTDFITRRVATQADQLVVVQTGGTLGKPIWTAYTADDYEAAFVRPFIDAARYVGFPFGGVWLYVGPSGPHVIGRAARSIALATGAMEPFTVDFDSRWARKLPVGSFAADRYVYHVVEQSMEVIETQPITHLFTTPPVLAALAQRMSSVQRARIRGVHYGGLAIEEEQLLRFQRDVFPDAVHLSGYGNTLFGCCLELDVSPGRTLNYFPRGDRIIFGALPESDKDAESIQFGAGAKGRCVFSRFDSSMLLINFIERDDVELVAPPPDIPVDFRLVGVHNPCAAHSSRGIAPIGIY